MGVLIENAYRNVPYYNNLFHSLKLKPPDIKRLEDHHETDGQAVLRELRDRIGDGVDLKIVFVDDIEPMDEGKFKWIRSEIL